MCENIHWASSGSCHFHLLETTTEQIVLWLDLWFSHLVSWRLCIFWNYFGVPFLYVPDILVCHNEDYVLIKQRRGTKECVSSWYMTKFSGGVSQTGSPLNTAGGSLWTCQPDWGGNPLLWTSLSSQNQPWRTRAQTPEHWAHKHVCRKQRTWRVRGWEQVAGQRVFVWGHTGGMEMCWVSIKGMGVWGEAYPDGC